MHSYSIAATMAIALTGVPVEAQESDEVRFHKVELVTDRAGKAQRVRGELRLTADSLVFQFGKGTTEQRLDLLAVDSIYPLFGSSRTRTSVITGWLALGLTGALISRSQEEFVLLRVRGPDSLEVWSFKVPNLKAMEIGNAIWAKWKAKAARQSEAPVEERSADGQSSPTR